MERASIYELVASPLEDVVVSVFKQAQESLFVSAPYIKSYGVELLLSHTKARRLTLLTNLSLENATSAGFDFDSLLGLGQQFELTVSSLEKLHAKIYVADTHLALVTSANLTRGGLQENYEYGVLLRDKNIVQTLQTDMEHYFSLGNIFDAATLLEVQKEVQEIKRLRIELERSAQAHKLSQALKAKEESLQVKLLTNRIRGRTINSIFSETILYLLRRHGPLPTEQLHAFIKEIHPDICDDTIDRVINGQRFGKKWKHMVRNAQQFLKAGNLITLRDGRWELTGSSS